MSAKQLGFGSSLRMLTRDKGWLKPVMVLALVGWIPLVGQIVILGYAYEWARLTAWGVDAAPKQRGVDYGKVMTTGARSFGVVFLMELVVAMLSLLLPALGTVTAGVVSLLSPLGALSLFTSGALLISVILMAAAALLSTFLSVCALRAVIYDRFAAGWRVDRVFQMVARDFGGFMHAFLVSLLANLLPLAFALVASILGVIFFSAGAIGYGQASIGFAPSEGFPVGYVMGFVLIAVVLVVLAIFAYECFAVVAQLVSVNAVGQWVQRFDVSRWGTSADPLPTDVPHRNDSGSGSAAPLPPSETYGGSVSSEATNPNPVAPSVSDSAPAPSAPADASAPSWYASSVDKEEADSPAPAEQSFIAPERVPPAWPAPSSSSDPSEGEGPAAEGSPAGAAADSAWWETAPAAGDAAQTIPLPPVPGADVADGQSAASETLSDGAFHASTSDDAAPTTVLPPTYGGNAGAADAQTPATEVEDEEDEGNDNC